MRLPELAALLGAELVVPAGAGDVSAIEIGSVAAHSQAVEWQLVFAESEAAVATACASRAGAVITSRKFAGDHGSKPMLLVNHPKLAFARAADVRRRRRKERARAVTDGEKRHPATITHMATTCISRAKFQARMTSGSGWRLMRRPTTRVPSNQNAVW